MNRISYKLEDLNKFNIHQLREVARRLNIQSPATKKRAELLELIIKRMNGDYKPYITQVGRPAKTKNMDIFKCLFPCVNEIDELAVISKKEKIKEEKTDNIAYSMSLPYKNLFALCCPKAKYEAGLKKNYYDDTINGNLFVFHTGYGVVRQNPFDFNSNFALISNIQIKDNNFRTGDYISGTFSKQGEQRLNTMISVDKQHSTERKIEMSLFDDWPIILGNNKISLNVDENDESAVFYLNCGGRYFTQFSNRDTLYKSLPYFLKQLENNFDKTIIIDFNAISNEQIYTDSIDTYKIGYELDNNIKILTANFVIELAKRRAEKGEKVLLLFTEFSQYIRFYDACVKVKVDDNTINCTLHATREIMQVSRCSNVGSITMLVMDSVNVPLLYSDIMNYDVIPFFNCSVTAT